MPEDPIYRRAAAVLRGDGVIAYPTEGVYGLGCLPGSRKAVDRILAIKNRRRSMGLILVTANPEQAAAFVVPADLKLLARVSRDTSPVTWLVTARPETPAWITGGRTTVAVRISIHPVVRSLCLAAGSALVSTSANISGQPPVSDEDSLAESFSGLVDLIVPGPLGGSGGPTEIRDIHTGASLRAAPAGDAATD